MEKEREGEREVLQRVVSEFGREAKQPFTCSRDGMGIQRRKEYRMLTSHSDDGVRRWLCEKGTSKGRNEEHTWMWPNSNQYQPSIQGASRKNVKIDWEKIKSSSRCRLATFQGKSSSFKCVHGRDGSCGGFPESSVRWKKSFDDIVEEKRVVCKRRNCLYLYFALHVYNAGAFFEEREKLWSARTKTW